LLVVAVAVARGGGRPSAAAAAAVAASEDRPALAGSAQQNRDQSDPPNPAAELPYAFARRRSGYARAPAATQLRDG